MLGAVRAIQFMGPRTSQIVVVPHIKDYVKALQPKLNHRNEDIKRDAHKVFDALKVRSFLL